MRKQRVVSTEFSVVDPDGMNVKTFKYKKAAEKYVAKHPLSDALSIEEVNNPTVNVEGEEVNG